MQAAVRHVPSPAEIAGDFGRDHRAGSIGVVRPRGGERPAVKIYHYQVRSLSRDAIDEVVKQGDRPNRGSFETEKGFGQVGKYLAHPFPERSSHWDT